METEWTKFRLRNDRTTENCYSKPQFSQGDRQFRPKMVNSGFKCVVVSGLEWWLNWDAFYTPVWREWVLVEWLQCSSMCFFLWLIRQRVYSMTLHPSPRMRETNEEFLSHPHIVLSKPTHPSYPHFLIPPQSPFPVQTNCSFTFSEPQYLKPFAESQIREMVIPSDPHTLTQGDTDRKSGNHHTTLQFIDTSPEDCVPIGDNTSYPCFNNKSYHFSRYK